MKPPIIITILALAVLATSGCSLVSGRTSTPPPADCSPSKGAAVMDKVGTWIIGGGTLVVVAGYTAFGGNLLDPSEVDKPLQAWVMGGAGASLLLWYSGRKGEEYNQRCMEMIRDRTERQRQALASTYHSNTEKQ